MPRCLFRCSNVMQLLALLMIVLIASPSLKADDHILSVKEVNAAAVQAAQTREKNQADVDRFLANNRVNQVMKQHAINGEYVHNAIAFLSDADMSTLAAKARAVESDIAGGTLTLTDAQTTLFILGFFFLVFMAILVIAFK
jgi:hypothetical protein